MGIGEMKQPQYVCVYVPEFPAQALLRLRPDLAPSPVAVLAGVAPFEEVCSANAQAFQMGIMQGMTRAELDSFPGLSILRRSEAEEHIARNVLLEAAGAFTPRIEVQKSTDSTFVMVLDMTGTDRIFGTAQESLKSIKRAFSKLRLFTQLAASANLHAAVCVAPTARRVSSILPMGKEREYLSPLPLSALNLTELQAETLSLWGLHTLGELAALSEVDLVVRLGQQGKRLRLLARGEHPHLMVPEEPIFILVEFIAFDSPIESLESLLFVVAPMLDQLLARAQNRAFALASLTITFGLDGGAEHERTIKPALPVVQREVLLKLLHLDLQAHPPSAGVLSILATADPGDRSKVQLGLFVPQLPEPLRLDVTLARIAALVGGDRVGRARLVDSHRAGGFRMEHFSVADLALGTKKIKWIRQSIALRRCRPPLGLLMHREGAVLKAFSLLGKQYTVQEFYGPWRKSGDWWSVEVWSCEEWDVRAINKADEILLGVITHDLLRHHWRLEAVYD